MRAVVQRVRLSRVVVSDKVVGEIGRGLLILLGIRTGDSVDQARWLADKIVGMRIFEDEQGKMNVSVADSGGSVLVVSQFTLYGDCSKGRRPSFIDAARPEVAEPLYEAFANALRMQGVPVATGEFGAMMQVELVNDGPVTLVVDTPA
jgi:D-tyrosyl-tRNA(Tyr) deacylase